MRTLSAATLSTVVLVSSLWVENGNCFSTTTRITTSTSTSTSTSTAASLLLRQQQQQHRRPHSLVLCATPPSPSEQPAAEQEEMEEVEAVPPTQKMETANSVAFSEETNSVLAEATDALNAVGWGGSLTTPLTSDELNADDPFVREINAGIMRDYGVGLDELLNPAKVVNLERDLFNLRIDLKEMQDSDDTTLTEPLQALMKKINKKEDQLDIERRSVFRGWLKNIFLGQAVLSFFLSYVMATSPETLFGSFNWFYSYNMDISIKVLGYWWWWLFVVPSLRSRRPTGFEKSALDIAFLATPAISLLLPTITLDTGIIWCANLAVVTGSYGYAFVTQDSDGGDDSDANKPEWLKFVYRSLDFGGGKERGIRK